LEKLKIIVDDKCKTTVFMDGKKVQGIKRIEFEHDVEFSPVHCITYYSQTAKHERVDKE
jgi:hypothetical protein